MKRKQICAIVVLYRDTHKKEAIASSHIYADEYRWTMYWASGVIYIYKKSLFILQIQLIKRAQEPNYAEKTCTARKTVSPSNSIVKALSKWKGDLVKCTDLTSSVYILPLGEGVQVPPFLQ